MQRALIIGCGYTGRVLAGRLVRRGVDVFGTTVSGQDAPYGVTLHALDLKNPPNPLELPAIAGEKTVVYYMVSTLFRHHDPQARPHLAPLRAVLDTLAQSPPAGLVYLSSTSVYGDQGGGWVDEQTAVAPRSPWAHMRVDLEREVWAFGAEHGVPACVARLPEIYGPGRGPAARLKRGYTLRYPHRFSNRIHVDDLAMVLDRLGERLDPKLLLVADGHPATTAEVYHHAARKRGLPPPPLGEPGVTDPNLRGLMSESKRCKTTRLQAWLDTPLAYPTYKEGLEAT